MVVENDRSTRLAPASNRDSSPREISAAMLTDRLRYSHHVDAFGYLDDDATWYRHRE